MMQLIYVIRPAVGNSPLTTATRSPPIPSHRGCLSAACYARGVSDISLLLPKLTPKRCRKVHVKALTH
jgi:hypothetical protein